MDHELVTPCYSEATMPTSKVKTELGFSDVLCSWHSCPCFDAGHNCCLGVRFRLSLHPQGVRSFPQQLLLLISGLERTNPSRRNILWCFIISSPPCLKIWFLSLICSFICLFVCAWNHCEPQKFKRPHFLTKIISFSNPKLPSGSLPSLSHQITADKCGM